MDLRISIYYDEPEHIEAIEPEPEPTCSLFLLYPSCTCSMKPKRDWCHVAKIQTNAQEKYLKIF